MAKMVKVTTGRFPVVSSRSVSLGSSSPVAAIRSSFSMPISLSGLPSATCKVCVSVA